MPTRAPLKQKHLDWLEFEGEITQLVSNTHIEEAVIWCAETLAPISHWRTSFLFRATLDNVHAVSFDMMLPRYHKHNKEKTNSLGSLKVTTFNTASNPVTTRPRDKFSAPFLDQNITVSSLLRAVQDNGLQFYQFECGSGCLCWNLELLRVLVEFGWVKPNSQQKLEAQIDDWRSKHPHQKNKIPRPFCKGKFVQGPMSYAGEAVPPRLRRQEGLPVPDSNRRRVLSMTELSQLPVNGGHRFDPLADPALRDSQRMSRRRYSI